MTEINIAGYVKELMIFDDPEYCTSNMNYGNPVQCRYYYADCLLFDEELEEKNIDTTGTIIRIVKCDACKAEWRKAREEENGRV